MISKKKFYLPFVILLLAGAVNAQTIIGHTASHVTVVAGQEYQKTKLGQWLWGKNRRQEWLTPVQVPIVLLDTIHGGLIPYKKSGGGESKSLRLRSTDGKEYALRSINKTRGKTLPAILKNSLYGEIVKDGVSMSHPFAAFALPAMLQNAKIFHAQPKLIYLPGHAALDTFNDQFANDVYLLEERPVRNLNDAPHLGNYKKYFGTIEVKEKLRDDNHYKVDQQALIKARLFDILISDVDRHGGNWKWGIEDGASKIFIPVPNDRDQAFFTHDGLLTNITIAITRLRFLQSFEHTIKNVKTLTSHDRMLDKYFATEMDYMDWQEAAATLRQTLTDSVITKSIGQLPPEIFAVSGKEIIEKLQHRRNKLEHYAARYYYTLAKRVEINGTTGKEFFEVKKLNDKQIAVKGYRINSQGKKEAKAYYQRIFNSNETKQITLYGFGGKDDFNIDKGIAGIKIILRKGINKIQFPGKNGEPAE